MAVQEIQIEVQSLTPLETNFKKAVYHDSMISAL